jgi:phosphoribosylaminoimidazole-succinocarboxamide synthase
MSTSPVQLETSLPRLSLFGRGKVRDIYAVEDRLLIVATDRISAFDFILGSGIPQKGKVLTQISLFWFEMMKDLSQCAISAAARISAKLAEYASLLEGRSMLVKKPSPFRWSVWREGISQVPDRRNTSRKPRCATLLSLKS